MISRPDRSIRNRIWSRKHRSGRRRPIVSRLLCLDAEFAENAIEIVASIVLDGDGPAFVSMMDDDTSRQAVRQEILHPLDSGRKAGIIRGERRPEDFPARASCWAAKLRHPSRTRPWRR